MSDDVYILREQAQWRHGKSPLIIKYLDDHAKMMAEIAGRGFLSLPGYSYDIENNLELMTKMGLSELNYKILSETIERELKQTGIDYDLAYRNASIAWEIEKQALMIAWDSEYASLRQGLAWDEETLNRLAIEVSKRGILLLTSKTALELQMEADRKILAQLESSTTSYDIQLANAKLLTAQKKLELIPILQTIITKEQELLVVEQSKAAAYTSYMVAEEGVVAKKQTLAPYINEVATDVEELTIAINTIEIPVETQIANEKLTQANLEVEKAGYKVEELGIDIDIENKTIILEDDKRILEETKFADEQQLIRDEIALTTIYENDMMKDFNQIIQDEKDLQANIVAGRTNEHDIRNKIKLESVIRLDNETKSIDARVNAENIYEMEQKAEIEVASKITATLEHLIG